MERRMTSEAMEPPVEEKGPGEEKIWENGREIRTRGWLTMAIVASSRAPRSCYLANATLPNGLSARRRVSLILKYFCNCRLLAASYDGEEDRKTSKR
jgi:hypothetical protein